VYTLIFRLDKYISFICNNEVQFDYIYDVTILQKKHTFSRINKQCHHTKKNMPSTYDEQYAIKTHREICHQILMTICRHLTRKNITSTNERHGAQTTFLQSSACWSPANTPCPMWTATGPPRQNPPPRQLGQIRNWFELPWLLSLRFCIRCYCVLSPFAMPITIYGVIFLCIILQH